MKKRLLSVFLALALCVGLAVPAFAADSGFVINDEGWLVEYTGPGGDVVIPDGVTVIGYRAFKSREDVTSVTIPEGVTEIVTSAFEYCTSLASVTIPKSVDFIDGSSFFGTPWLKQQGDFVVVNGILIRYQGTSANVVIPDNVTTIASTAFSFNSKADLTSVTIPDGVTTIENQAFFACKSLSSVTISSGVTSIGACAFDSCDSLTDIYFGGSEAQWEAIQDHSMFSDNNPVDVVIHYNSPVSAPAPAFTDIPSWCADSVAWAVDNGITTGTGNNKFSPDRSCTHEEILTFLYRAARGEGKADAADMAAAVSWAREKGMIGENFDPKAPCTRARAVDFIWRAFNSPTGEGAPYGTFSDVSPVSEGSVGEFTAIHWAAGLGIANGYRAGDAYQFRPNDTCTRGQIVTFLHRAYVPSARLS